MKFFSLPSVLMFLPYILFSLFLISIPAPIAGEDPLLTLPKQASLQQVLTFLKELKKMMKGTRPSFRLQKRGDQDCCNETIQETAMKDKDVGLANLVAKRLRSKLSGSRPSQGSKYFPALNNFRPAYYDWVGMMDKVGK